MKVKFGLIIALILAFNCFANEVYKGDIVVTSKDFFEQIEKTCPPNFDDEDPIPFDIYRKKCLFYKLRDQQNRIWQLPANQEILVGKKANIIVYMRKIVTNQAEKIELIAKKNNQIIDTLLLDISSRKTPQTEKIGDTDFSSTNDFYYIDKSLNVTVIGVVMFEDVTPVYRNYYSLDEKTGSFQLAAVDVWTTVEYMPEYKFNFLVSENSPSIESTSLNYLKQNLDTCSLQSFDSASDSCRITSVYKDITQVKDNQNDILENIKRQYRDNITFQGEIVKLVNDNQQAWENYENTYCLFNVLGKDLRFAKVYLNYYDNVSACISSMTKQNVLQQEKINKQIKDKKVNISNLTIKLTSNFQNVKEAYNQQVEYIKKNNNKYQAIQLAYLAKLKESWQKYAETNCRLTIESSDNELIIRCLNKFDKELAKQFYQLFEL